MRVKAHFDSRAENYDSNRERGILGRIVEKEKDVVVRLLDCGRGEEVLDAGCGSGYYSLLLKEGGAKPFGVDLSEGMINALRKKGVNGVVGDLESVDLKRVFDKVLCCGALEFVNNPDRVIKNLSTHSKKRGVLVLLYPRKSLGGVMYLLYHVVLHGIRIRLFSKREIGNLLGRNEFRILCFKKPDFITMAVKAERL